MGRSHEAHHAILHLEEDCMVEFHSKAIGKGKLTTEAKVGQREGEGPSHCLPQALSGTVNKSWRSLVKSE